MYVLQNERLKKGFMKKVIVVIALLLLSASIFAQNRVEATNRGISNARPGDYIIRSNGQRVTLSQGDIDYARRQLGQSVTRTQNSTQSRPAATNTNRTSSPSNSSGGIVIFLLVVVGVIIVISVCVSNITTTVAKSSGMDEKSAKKIGTSAGVLAGTAAAIGAAVLLGKSGGVKPNKNNITVTHRHQRW
jgi:hypothetical protein